MLLRNYKQIKSVFLRITSLLLIFHANKDRKHPIFFHLNIVK